jgi:hypothetical protein
VVRDVNTPSRGALTDDFSAYEAFCLLHTDGLDTNGHSVEFELGRQAARTAFHIHICITTIVL